MREDTRKMVFLGEDEKETVFINVDWIARARLEARTRAL